MWLSTSARPNPSGPMRIPSTISSTTVGQDDPAVQPRQDRAGARGGEDQHERTGVRQRRVHGKQDECDHAGSVGVIPHVLVNEPPGSSRITASPVRNAFGGQVIGSTARLRRLTSGSGSPVKSITYR